MTRRQLVSERELNTWMTKELRDLGVRNGTQILMKSMLSQPDEAGCNWSPDVYVSSGFNNVEQMRLVVGPAAARVVERAQAEFNVHRRDA